MKVIIINTFATMCPYCGFYYSHCHVSILGFLTQSLSCSLSGILTQSVPWPCTENTALEVEESEWKTADILSVFQLFQASGHTSRSSAVDICRRIWRTQWEYPVNWQNCHWHMTKFIPSNDRIGSEYFKPLCNICVFFMDHTENTMSSHLLWLHYSSFQA